MNGGNDITIAYAEDQDGFRESVREYLESRGIKVVFDSADGSELITFLKQCYRLPDLCILDISMPNMDGHSLLKAIRKSWRHMPCLIYSMHEAEPAILKALSLGANGYLSKQMRFADLYDAIQEVVTNGVVYTKYADAEKFRRLKDENIKIPLITEREREFLRHVVTELPYAEIARAMNVTRKTVEGYRERCFEKLQVKTRTGLAMTAVRLGIIYI